MDKHKFELLKKYFHPTSYKLFGQKKDEMKLDGTKLDGTKFDGTKLDGTKFDGTKLDGTKFDEVIFNEKSKNLDSADISIKIKPFHLKVYGIQLIVHNPQQKKSLIITGTIDDRIFK
jgi:hypothetical protein